MIPVLYNEGPLWLLGIAWNAEMLAAFLAWWMPLNLLTYLAILFFGLTQGWKLRPQASSLKQILLSSLLTWPAVVGLALLALFEEFILIPRRKKKEREALANYHRSVRQ